MIDDLLVRLAKQILAKKICLVVSRHQDYNEVNTTLIKYLTLTLKLKGIYIALNSRYVDTVQEIRALKIPADSLCYIDAVTNQSGMEEDSRSCVYIQGPDSLTELSLAVHELTKLMNAQFVFLDSVTTLLTYNTAETTERFMHYFLNKVRTSEMTGVVISLDEEKSNKLIPVLSQISDVVIDLTKD